MADYYPAQIRIGGPIPSAILPKLMDAIMTERLQWPLDGIAVTRESLEKELSDGRCLDLLNPEASCGQLEHLVCFLVNHGIHFNSHSDAYREYNAENGYYRGGDSILSLAATQEGVPLIKVEAVARVLRDRALDDHAKIVALRDLVTRPELEPLAPIRLT